MKPSLSTIFGLLRIGGRKMYTYGLIYTALRQWCRVKKNFVVLESSLGLEFGGNPYAIAALMAAATKYRDFKLIITAPWKVRASLRQNLGRKNIRYTTKNSLRYTYYLATAEYLVNDVTFPEYFNRRAEQKYLNTWHGTPLKTLGRKIRKDTFRAFGNSQRNFLHATALLAPNEHTERVLLDDYMIRDVWNGRIIRCGYPRNDILFNSISTYVRNERLNVAFMPTWRGSAIGNKADSAAYLNELTALLGYLDKSIAADITLWVRLHPLIAGQLDLSTYSRIEAFPKSTPVYTWLAQCDALITDYSSVLFDYSVTGRAILLYTADRSTYADNRGFSLDPKVLPFPTFSEPQALTHAINALALSEAESRKLDAAYVAFQSTFCPWRRGDNTERACEHFFLENRSRPVTNPNRSEKKSLLIYVGALLSNGIISSFKALIPLIDTEKYDITILVSAGENNKVAEDYFQNLPSEIRFIPLRFRLWMTPIEFLTFFYFCMFKKDWSGSALWLARLWGREFLRTVGSGHFDVFINFDGYSWRTALLGLGSPCKKVTYVHNEMVKEINAKRVADNRLLLLSYKTANRIAVIRKGIETEYCRQYFDYRDKVSYVPNALSLDVSSKATQPLHQAFLDGTDAPNFTAVQEALELAGAFRFVNLGRFSPEKGQLRLIDAFERVHAEHRYVQLYIIGGHGRIQEEVERRARSSAARDAIFVVTGSSNPFPLVRRMDAFVLSSTYEGLPVVFFEMLQLQIPIVSTRIPGPAEFLSDGYGLLVDNSTEGLIEGMRAALAGTISAKPFDFEAHNLAAVQSFYDLVESADSAGLANKGPSMSASPERLCTK